MTITEFLEARFAEDEAVVHEAETWFRQEYGDRAPTTTYVAWDEHPLGAVVSDPGRAMREVEAKRAIIRDVELLTGGGKSYMERLEHSTVEDERYVITRRMLGHLAAVYSDHPDFDPSWAA